MIRTLRAALVRSSFSELDAMAEKYDESLSWLGRKAILEF
jgi:hypothetical protein